MNDTEQKALALVNEVADIGCYALCDAHPINLIEALCRAIERHEAFRQEVSDAAEVYEEMGCPVAWEGFEQFIISKPKPKPKPDPLVEMMEKLGWYNAPTDAKALRAALDARGLEIREKGR